MKTKLNESAKDFKAATLKFTTALPRRVHCVPENAQLVETNNRKLFYLENRKTLKELQSKKTMASKRRLAHLAVHRSVSVEAMPAGAGLLLLGGSIVTGRLVIWLIVDIHSSTVSVSFRASTETVLTERTSPTEHWQKVWHVWQ